MPRPSRLYAATASSRWPRGPSPSRSDHLCARVRPRPGTTAGERGPQRGASLLRRAHLRRHRPTLTVRRAVRSRRACGRAAEPEVDLDAVLREARRVLLELGPLRRGQPEPAEAAAGGGRAARAERRADLLLVGGLAEDDAARLQARREGPAGGVRGR